MDKFVDRDVFMEYLGGGVGHTTLRKHVSFDNAVNAIGVELLSFYKENEQLSAGKL